MEMEELEKASDNLRRMKKRQKMFKPARLDPFFIRVSIEEDIKALQTALECIKFCSLAGSIQGLPKKKEEGVVDIKIKSMGFVTPTEAFNEALDLCQAFIAEKLLSKNLDQLIGEWQLTHGIELSLEQFQSLRTAIQNEVKERE